VLTRARSSIYPLSCCERDGRGSVRPLVGAGGAGTNALGSDVGAGVVTGTAGAGAFATGIAGGVDFGRGVLSVRTSSFA
jgi:hypothetical protein